MKYIIVICWTLVVLGFLALAGYLAANNIHGWGWPLLGALVIGGGISYKEASDD